MNSTSRVVAVIDIGATSVRMQIAQAHRDGSVEKLESLSQAVSIGKDSFTSGSIGRATIEDCVRVLEIYRNKLDEYGVTEDSQIRVVATSGVRDASNRVAFQDRVYVATGFNIESFDQAELHRATYLGVLPYLQQGKAGFSGRTAVCEVGGGTTELLLLQDKDVEYSSTFRLGSLRLFNMLEAYDATSESSRSLLELQIGKAISDLDDCESVKHFISMGSEVRHVAAEFGTDRGGGLSEVDLAELENYNDSVLAMSPSRISHDFHMALPDAQTYAMALFTHAQIARSLGAKKILVSDINLRDSLLREMVGGETWSEAIQEQIVRSAIQLGRKFSFDESHSVHVAKIALQLFDSLADRHGLDKRHASILRLAAILHEVGRAVNLSAYHKHSMYLIRNSDFFGIGDREQQLIALVARYHRRAMPNSGHDSFSRLDREERLVVSKLASILRIANSMDEGHEQKIKSFRCKVTGNRVSISIHDSADVSLERMAVRQTKQLFENIFGMEVQLEVNAT